MRNWKDSFGKKITSLCTLEEMLFNFKRVDKKFYEYFIYTYVQTSKF